VIGLALGRFAASDTFGYEAKEKMQVIPCLPSNFARCTPTALVATRFT
jgi:hypothetical protein